MPNTPNAAPDLDALYGRALKPYDGPLSPEVLIAEAEQATGLSDWGGERWGEARFRGRLQALCTALENESFLTPVGRSRAHGRLHVALCSRLRMNAWRRGWQGEAPVKAPLVGTGFPRAGTSFLHQLLAQDPENLSCSTAEAAIPTPPPGDAAFDAARNAFVQRILEFQGLDAPEVEAVHPFDPDQPDECLALQESGIGSLYQAFFNVPSFMARVVGEMGDLFAWEVGMMQILQSSQSKTRWVLKTPEHMNNWETMIKVFPDARIFLNHRDPAKVIPSICSLFLTFCGLNSNVRVDPKLVGPATCARMAATMDRVTAWRRANPAVKVVDVHYRTLVADPVAEAERVYGEFGLELSGNARDRMASFLKVNRHGQGPKHAYSLEDFGLDAAQLETHFGRYIDEFGIAREARS